MFAFALALSVLAGQPSSAAHPVFTPDQAANDLAVAREALERLHPGYDRYADRADLDAAWRALETGAEDGADLAELYLGLSGLLAEIRCDHTKAELPAPAAEQWETAPVYPPFRFTLFEGRMFVDVAAPGVDLQRGEEILSLDDEPVADRLAAARSFMPVDGFTDHVRDLELAASGEFLGSGFAQFDALLNPDDDQVVLRVRGLDGAERIVNAPRIGFAAFRDLTGEPRWRNFSDDGAVSVDMIAPGVARLNVETFVNYRTRVSPTGVFRPIFQRLNAAGVETLIVDLRRNGGGSTDAQLVLLAHLTRTASVRVGDFTIVESYDFSGLREHIRTWDPSALDPDPERFIALPDGRFQLSEGVNSLERDIRRAEHAFDGEVVLLTSRANASGVTQMIGALRNQDHVTLIGEETGGSQEGPTAGVIWFVELPQSGIVVRVPWWLQISTLADPAFGRGFQPDIAARDTYETWLSGRDPALEAAAAFAAR